MVTLMVTIIVVLIVNLIVSAIVVGSVIVVFNGVSLSWLLLDIRSCVVVPAVEVVWLLLLSAAIAVAMMKCLRFSELITIVIVEVTAVGIVIAAIVGVPWVLLFALFMFDADIVFVIAIGAAAITLLKLHIIVIVVWLVDLCS